MAGKPYAKYIRRAVGGTAIVLVPSCSYVAYKYRPRASFDVDYHETLRTNHDEPSGTIERWLYKMTGNAICGFVTTIFTSLLKGGNTFEVIDREKLDNLVVNDRPDNTPLITVANHISCLDDPGMVSALFPLPVCFSHDRMRWGICTEEICFSSPGLASFFAMGKALPVQRGGSIHQKGIATLQDKLNRGDWVHVFPEGRVWQEAGIPLRDEEGRWCSASGRCGPAGQKVGPMKWGVGKLIANSYPKTPIVLPFFHMGMQDVLPQDDANQLMGKPIFFANTLITVKIGDPIPVSDLIAAYHTAARQRAEARNIERAARLRLEEVTRGIWQWNKERREPQEGRSGPTSTSGGGGRWLSWLWPWPASSAAAPASAATSAAAPPLPSSTSYDARLRPVNTVEDYADHTGSSARIAGLTTAASKQPVNTVEMYSDHSGASAHVAGLTRAAGRAEVLQAHDQHALRGGRHNADDKDLVDSLVREARDTADRLLSTVGSEARESSERMISAAIEAVTEAEAHAEHVSNQARVLMTRLKQLAEDKENEAKHRIAQLSAEGEREAVELSQRIEREARSRLPPLIADHLPTMPVPRLPSWWPFRSSAGSGDNSDSSSNNAASGVDGGGGASDDATRHAHSVSWPAPQRVPWPPGSPAPAPAIAAGSGGDSTSDTSSSSTALYGQAAHAAASSTSSAASSSASSPAAGGGAGSGGMDGSSSNNNSSNSGGPGPRKTRSEDPFPLSDEPVIEVVPTRRLKTGTQVPLYVEAPLRIKPPDHEWLTSSEAEAEEGIRLQLYSDIAARVGETLAVLERDVMAHRQARGWTERRPMK